MGGIYPNNINREFHILHPKRIIAGLVKLEQHAPLWLQTSFTAQALLSLAVSFGYLNSYDVAPSGDMAVGAITFAAGSVTAVQSNQADCKTD